MFHELLQRAVPSGFFAGGTATTDPPQYPQETTVGEDVAADEQWAEAAVDLQANEGRQDRGDHPGHGAEDGQTRGVATGARRRIRVDDDPGVLQPLLGGVRSPPHAVPQMGLHGVPVVAGVRPKGTFQTFHPPESAFEPIDHPRTHQADVHQEQAVDQEAHDGREGDRGLTATVDRSRLTSGQASKQHRSPSRSPGQSPRRPPPPTPPK